MKKSVAKNANRISGGRIAVMSVSVILLSIIMAFGMLLGISAFKHNEPIVVSGENATTVRRALPTDGALPTQSTPIDNIGRMAYVLDNQPFYHVYARNSTKSTGYEQITQSWKDYKNAELSGAGLGVMVCSDLSYSSLVKSSSQSCFIGDNEAHIRGGNKPSKESGPLDIEWSTDAPTVYDKEKYKYDYGEFSTEISVYVINEETLAGAEDVIDNGNGTYTQTYHLNEKAGCWYQYGMKTRGGLKSYPVFKKIDITFTFDANWRVMESFCDETAVIRPRALGGLDMESASKTTTTFDYSEAGFDNAHFAYFDSYFKGYKGSQPAPVAPTDTEITITDVLGSGFGKVLSPSGQQFNVALTLGGTEYEGKLYAKLGDMEKILETLNVRFALEKKGSGRQDFYLEFAGGAINVYYSTDFALTVSLDDVSDRVNSFKELIKGFGADKKGASPVAFPLTETAPSEGGIDLDALLDSFVPDIGDTSATIALQSDDLLGMGIGVDVVFGFDVVKEEDGAVFSIKSLDLNYVKYKGEIINVKLGIVPDDGEIIFREPAQTPANLADYADSVYKILSSNTIAVNIGLADKLVEGLSLDAKCNLSIGSGISANVALSAAYKGVSLKLGAAYVYDGAGYGKVYLNVTEINGAAVDAKIYCDIADAERAVRQLLAVFGVNSASKTDEQAADGLVAVVNKVLNLDFSAVIGKITANADTLTLAVDADALLSGLGIQLGINFGTLSLAVDRADSLITGEAPSLGLNLSVSGSEEEFLPVPDIGNYVNLVTYIDSITGLLQKPAYEVELSFGGAKFTENVDLSALKISGTAKAEFREKTLFVNVPVKVEYNEYGLELGVYYTVELTGGSYGKAYVNVTKIKIGEKESALDAKIYCDIKETVESVKALIAKFIPETQSAEDKESGDILAKAVDLLLTLDYNEIINATNEKLSVKIDADEILSKLGINLGGVSLGILNLGYEPATGTLSGGLSDKNLTLTVRGSDEGIKAPELGSYVSLQTYLDGISALLSKTSYGIELDFEGNDALGKGIKLSGLKVGLKGRVSVNEGYSGITAEISELKVSYGEISAELSARYDIKFGSGYGKVYLNVTELNGKAVDAKIYCDIADAVDGIMKLVELFTEKQDGAEKKAEQTDVLSKVIEGVLKLDFNKIITATDEKADISLDLNAVLSGLGLGINFGTVNLTYYPDKCELTGYDTAIGINGIKLFGSDEKIPAFSQEGYINLNDFIDGVSSLIFSPVYEVKVAFAGTQITDKLDLQGLTVDATAYVSAQNSFNDITVNAEATVTYCGLSVGLTVYYSADIKSGRYTEVYVNIISIDGTPVNAKLYCDIADAISAVKDIISLIKPAAAQNETEATQTNGKAEMISKAIGFIVSLDYNEIITATGENLSVNLNADELLSVFGVDLKGIQLGDIRLDLSLNGGASLKGGLDEIGVSLEVKGNGEYTMPAAPSAGEYLDVTSLLRLAESVISEGKAIAEAKDVILLLEGKVVTDSDEVTVGGRGEVIWGDTVKVALSLNIETGGESFEVNFIYDGTATGVEPIVIMTVNGDGVKVSRNEIDKLIDSFSALVGTITGGNGDKKVAPDASGYALEVGGRPVSDILANANVKKILGKIVSFMNSLIVGLEKGGAESEIYDLVIRHTGGLKIDIGADGRLAIGIEKGENFSLTASASAGDGSMVLTLRDELSANEKTDGNPDGKHTYYELSRFVNLLYGNIIDKIDGISFKEFLGDNAYALNLNIDGAESGIPALEGVKVDARMYYDEGISGTRRTTKLIHTDLEMEINGTDVLASLSLSGHTIFVELQKIGNMTLVGIKFRVNTDYLFDAVEQLVRLVTDTDFVETFNRIYSGTGSQPVQDVTADVENLALFSEMTDENGESAPSLLTKLIEGLLTFDIEQSFVFGRENGTAKINVDSLASVLLGVNIGDITVKADGDKKTLEAAVKLAEKDAWLTLDAAPCDRRADAVNPDSYLSIDFLSTLVGDIVETVATPDKRMYRLYSFSGTISIDITDIPVLGTISLRLTNATLTVGLDENDEFYVTLGASMQKTTLIGLTVTEEKDISITYSGGLIVLGRDIGTKNEEYKVLTLEYLLDNVLDKNNSPIQWLLGTNSTAWGLVADNVNVDIDSGLTKPRTYTLYEQLKQNVKEDKFDLFDYISGMTVKAGDSEPLSILGEGAALATEKFNLYGDVNHYAVDINAKRLTGGTVTALCAALMRNSDGISGIKAYAEINSMVKLTLDFGTYLEGVTECYGGKVFTLKEVTVDEDAFYNNYYRDESVTAENFGQGKYFVYDSDSGTYVPAAEYAEGAEYYLRSNTEHYVISDGKEVLATVYDPDATYYVYAVSDSTKKLGEVACLNYLSHVTEKFGFDKDRNFGENSNHITKIFGCYSTNGNSYVSSDVLETIYLDVYAGIGEATPIKTLEVLYGSEVKLISPFPEFADEAKTRKLTYTDAYGNDLGDAIIITDGSVENYVKADIVYNEKGEGRVSIYTASESAVEVVLHFTGIKNMTPVSAALSFGDPLLDYPLNDYTFLGWYSEEGLVNLVKTVSATMIVDGKVHVYGKYVKEHIECENGVNYTFDNVANGYFVSGTNSKISAYYNNSQWLKIESELNGYKVLYIATDALSNIEKDTVHSLVNVLVPATVTAVYDGAFIGNKALKNVVFLAPEVFFGGRADADYTNSVFYDCYTDGNISGGVNTAFTVYYRNLRHNPYVHVTTTKNAVDAGGWNRVYFTKSWGSKTVYTANTKNSGWSFVDFEVEVIALDGTYGSLPADISSVVYNGLRFDGYDSAGSLANAISELLISSLGKNIYDVTASDAVTPDCKYRLIKITLTEHEEIVAKTQDITVYVKFGDLTVHTQTVLGVEANAELAPIYEELSFENKSDYAFLGWYKDGALEVLAPATNDGSVTELYARIISRVYTAPNGVVYTYGGSSYSVTGFGRGTDGTDYTDAANFLVLENTVSGVPVTAIADSVFADKSLKNVVIPANITHIGAGAFKNNKDMSTAVILADEITVGGNKDNGTYPFYGCSASNNDEITKLKIYYGGVKDMTGVDWAHFNTKGVISKTHYYVGNNGGALTSSRWSYVRYSVSGYAATGAYFGYVDGVLEAEVDEKHLSSVEKAVTDKLNMLHFESGVIYAYKVTAEDIFADNIHNINIVISDNLANCWHSVQTGAGLKVETSDGTVTLNGVIFARSGAVITVRAATGNEGLTSLRVVGTDGDVYDSGEVAVAESLSFTMPSVGVSISGVCAKLPIEKIMLKSSLRVEGYTLNGSWYEMQYSVKEGEPLPAGASIAGYTFIGWAYENDFDNLAFETTVTHTAYYAVWMIERAAVSAAVEDGAIKATCNADLTAGIYGWYKYKVENGEPVYTDRVELTALTVNDTVLNPRLKYNLQLNGEKNNGDFIYEDNFQSNIEILDGNKFWLRAYKNDNALVMQYVIETDDGIKSAGVYNKWWIFATFYTKELNIEVTGNNLQVSNNVTKDGTGSSSKTDYESDKLTDKITVDGNITVKYKCTC